MKKTLSRLADVRGGRPRLGSLRDADRRIVALASLAVIGAMLAFAFLYGQLGLFRGGYRVTAVFAETGGIRDGDDVRLAGVKVGSVTAIEPDFHRGHVLLTFQVDEGIELGPRTRADVQLSNLLGGRYLKLTGPVQKPYLDGLPEEKRRIPAERTGTPYTVVDALNKSTGDLGTLDMDALTKILNETEKLTLPSQKNLNKLLTNISTLNAALNDKSPQFQRLVSDADRLTGTLARKNADLTRLIEASRTLLGTLSEHRDELSGALGSGSRTATVLADVVDRRGEELDDLLANLHTITERLGPDMGDLNTTLALLGPTFEGLAQAGDTGRLAAVATGLGVLQNTKTILPPEARP
ncbi:MlaD family protein [Actinocorallia populi]|uniref:MlaD family protein n=1 Tax=Actinocorallia populi TaxID=2079200 RepID=UPI000D094EA2|nr:MlaD family protein [Actinocorallia populi]